MEKKSMSTPSLQDFSLINTYVQKKQEDLNLSDLTTAFYFFTLDLLFSLQDDEIDEAITDTAYLRGKGLSSGHDRGIDAVYIDSSQTPCTVHLFNFKYAQDFEHTKRHFPASEIDKICGFVSSLIQQDVEIRGTVNEVLYQAVEEIWDIFRSQNPNFTVHICTNYYEGFEPGERKRFEREIDKYSNFTIEYHLMPDFVLRLTHKDKQKVNARIRAIDKNLFEKSDGDIRALIVDVDGRDLIRIVLDDEEMRDTIDLEDYDSMKNFKILEDAFEDNVRIYLKLRSKINRNIKETASSEESHRFFYFNNGITLTCSEFSYPKQQRGPIITLTNLQVVNGSQSVHALYEAFLEDSSRFEDIDILCRIYQTHDRELSTNIAEYTNSQNPVKSRDIRSNDFTQKKLERELLALNYFYERKKGQYQGKPQHLRIDAEKAGQAIMAFFNKLPSEAKDKKKIIFAEMYDDVFHDGITACDLLTAILLFDRAEEKKIAKAKEYFSDPGKYESESFIQHASYYILYCLSELAELYDIPKKPENVDQIISLYDEADSLLRQSIGKEQLELEDYRENYNHRVFFKGNRPKKHLEEMFKKMEKEKTP